MQDVQTTLPLGTVIQGRYTVEDLLGKGGFGAVYLVRDLRTRGNHFALKEVIDPNKQDRERFIFEGEVLKRLDHQALPRVYRAFENDKQARAYILMDYIEGPNLEILRQRQPEKRFSLPQAMTFMEPIMSAVAYLHKQHPPIIHRDIKPANIIATGSEAVLVDFGIAKEYDPESTTTAIRRCSPGYGAPEQYSMGTDPRTDIYGVAATLYNLLTGVVPVDALYRLTQMGSRGNDPLEPLNQLVPAIAPEVAEVIQRAMAIDINARFATIEEFWQALKAAITANQNGPGVPIVVERPIDEVTTMRNPVLRGQRPSRSRRLAVLLVIVAALLVVGSAAAFWFSTTHGPASAVKSPTPNAQQTAASATHATATATRAAAPTPTPTPKATATPAPTATTAPASGNFPTLVPGYGGTLHNTPADVNGTMSLTGVRQNQGSISGNFSVQGPQLLGNGPFTGSVTTNNAISFTVHTIGVRPLAFSGTVHPNGSMDGTYCSLDANNNCNQAVGGYGTWHVDPTSQGSSSINTPGSANDRRNTRPVVG